MAVCSIRPSSALCHSLAAITAPVVVKTKPILKTPVNNCRCLFRSFSAFIAFCFFSSSESTEASKNSLSNGVILSLLCSENFLNKSKSGVRHKFPSGRPFSSQILAASSKRRWKRMSLRLLSSHCLRSPQ